MTPAIYHETNSGLMPVSVLDERLRHREIHLIETIDAHTAACIIAQIHYLEEQSSAPITIIIDSPGGSVYDGLAVYDAVMASPCAVNTVCTGIAASMASIIFEAGTTRKMLPHSAILIHDPLTMDAAGSALSVQQISDRLMNLRNIMADIYSIRTGISREDILTMTSTETLLNATEAVQKNFADAVIPYRKEEA